MSGSVVLQVLIFFGTLTTLVLADLDNWSGNIPETEASEESCAHGQDVVLLQTNLAMVQSHVLKSGENTSVLSVAGGHQDFNASSVTPSLLFVGAKMLLNAMINPRGPHEVAIGSPDIDLAYGARTVAGLLAVTMVLFVLGNLVVVLVPQDSHALCTQWLSLSMCFVLLALTYGSHAILQEYIMTMDYNGERFPSAAFLIFVSRILIVIVSSALLIYRGESLVMPASKYTSIPAATVFLSSWCQHTSLRFISFPTQMIFKSCKIVPTMFLNTWLNNARHSATDYGYAVVVTACVIGFVVAGAADSSSVSGADRALLIGILMMLFFLLCDSFTSNAEKRIFNSWRDFDNVQMMLAVGFFSLIYSVLGLLATFSFGEMHAFIVRNPECVSQIVLLSITSMCGQYLVFHIIRAHGPVVFSVMMTIRQMFSLAISTMLFGHPMCIPQKICAVVCFASLLLRPMTRLCLTEDPLDSSDMSSGQDTKTVSGQSSADTSKLVSAPPR